MATSSQPQEVICNAANEEQPATIIQWYGWHERIQDYVTEFRDAFGVYAIAETTAQDIW